MAEKMVEAPQNLRDGSRYLIAPPLGAIFGDDHVSVSDMSARGVRLRHATPLECGVRRPLKFLLDGRPNPVVIEGVVMWTQADAAGTTGLISGIRLANDPKNMVQLLGDLHRTNRSTRIEELRSTDRFLVIPAMKGTFSGRPIYIEDLSASGARIETLQELAVGREGKVVFRLSDSEDDAIFAGKVVWSALKSITGSFTTYRSGLILGGEPERVRAAITRLEVDGNASLDTQSLRLKLKVMRARARSAARTHPGTQAVGMMPEQYLLIEGVRQELRLNPEEAFHWYRRARMSIADPQTRTITPPISDHPDALAVWEYLDRSVDPSIIGRVFSLPGK